MIFAWFARILNILKSYLNRLKIVLNSSVKSISEALRFFTKAVQISKVFSLLIWVLTVEFKFCIYYFLVFILDELWSMFMFNFDLICTDQHIIKLICTKVVHTQHQTASTYFFFWDQTDCAHLFKKLCKESTASKHACVIFADSAHVLISVKQFCMTLKNDFLYYVFTFKVLYRSTIFSAYLYKSVHTKNFISLLIQLWRSSMSRSKNYAATRMILQEQADSRQRFSVSTNISCFFFVLSDSVVVSTCSTSLYESASVFDSISILKSSLRIIAKLYRFVC